jgi:hypothetical protein
VIALSIGFLVVIAGILLGWYGHKASLRIQAWGLNMNQQDHILQDLTDPEECMEFEMGYRQTGIDADSVPTLGNGCTPRRSCVQPEIV